MMCSPSARPQQATGTKKHQVRVTHSALGLHAGQPPDRSEGYRAVQPGLAARNMADSGASRTKWRQGNELGTSLAAKAGKGTEYATSIEVPLSQRLHAGQAPYTVKAEKGGTLPGAPAPLNQRNMQHDRICRSQH